MSQEQNNTFWNEIQGKYKIKNISYTPPYGEGAGMRVSLELHDSRARPGCPVCGRAPIIHAYVAKEVRFGAINGAPVSFEMEHCRYLCKPCDITFMEEFEWLLPHRGMAVDADNYILSKLGSQTFTELSADLGVCVQTVANRALSFGSQEREQQLNGHYRYLSMDEVFVSRNKHGEARYLWVLNDNSVSWKSNNVRMDEGRGKEDVIRRLGELAHPEGVAAVSIDMWKPYRDAIQEALPNAAVVIDPFHVIQAARKAMDSIRKKADVPKGLKSALKKDARLFLLSMFKLTDEELDRLESYLAADPVLEGAYFAVQSLSEFYRLRDYEHALDYLAKWESDVLESGTRELGDLLRTVVNWLPQIMNYFVHRITNGPTEGKNNLLRTIDRMGFHYGTDAIQACVYAHDRKQEYLKWKRHQAKRSKRLNQAA